MDEFDKVELMVSLENSFPPKLAHLIQRKFFDEKTIDEVCDEFKLSSQRQYYNLIRQIDKDVLRALLRECRIYRS